MKSEEAKKLIEQGTEIIKGRIVKVSEDAVGVGYAAELALQGHPDDLIRAAATIATHVIEVIGKELPIPGELGNVIVTMRFMDEMKHHLAQEGIVRPEGDTSFDQFEALLHSHNGTPQ